ncbi:hypothetical protein [Azospirillum sp. TSO22-1]|uniref:hypothetical protein n=1 Tax=Azospirillum sp. TSO22-1 TaxID=716789 RepID=UPI0011B6A652|nr:hypothetical protein [Azospirillum sp. TSO22-1]
MSNASRVTIQGAAGGPVMMRCQRRSVTLAESSCAASWETAQKKRPEPWEGRWHCRSCALGAEKAGKPLPQTAIAADALSCLCPRCFRPAPRLINGHLCVSCYNRDREVARGRNAKGGVPRLTAKLHNLTILIVEAGAVRRETLDRVTGPQEAMIMLAKRARRPIAFLRPIHRIGPAGLPPISEAMQLELPL